MSPRMKNTNSTGVIPRLSRSGDSPPSARGPVASIVPTSPTAGPEKRARIPVQFRLPCYPNHVKSSYRRERNVNRPLGERARSCTLRESEEEEGHMALRLDLVGIVTHDMGSSLAFYRRLGLDIPDGAEDEPHVEVV